MQHSFRTLLRIVILIMGLLLVPSIGKAYTVTWEDNGLGNDGNWYPMDFFKLLSGTTGSFASSPSINVSGWTGQLVDGNSAIAYGPPVVPGNFGMAVSFAGDPLSSQSTFDYYGYVNGTVVEGIRMIIQDGSWTGNWSFLDLNTAPLDPVATPEPATLVLLGFALTGLFIGFRKRSM